MPQKKNPDTLELTRGVAGDAIGEATGTLPPQGAPARTTATSQRAHAGVFEIADDVREATTEVAAGAVATADWDEVTLADAAGEGFSTATGVADLLAMSGMPFRTAHEIVATAAETVSDDDSSAAAAAKVDEATRKVTGEPSTHVSRDDVESALDPAASVASRDSAGARPPRRSPTNSRLSRHGSRLIPRRWPTSGNRSRRQRSCWTRRWPSMSDAVPAAESEQPTGLRRRRPRADRDRRRRRSIRDRRRRRRPREGTH